MKLFYFVGGPKKGQAEVFFTRLSAIGGTPAGWVIYPHVKGDGKALHVVKAESENQILDHLLHFEGIYDHGAIIEIRTPRP